MYWHNDFYNLKCWAGWFKTGTLSSFLFLFEIQVLFLGLCFIWCFSMKNLRLSWSKNDPLVAIWDLMEALFEFVVIKERTLVLILAIFLCYRWFIIAEDSLFWLRYWWLRGNDIETGRSRVEESPHFYRFWLLSCPRWLSENQN